MTKRAGSVPDHKLVNGDTAFFTFATAGYVPFVKNLHESLRLVEAELADKLIVYCADDATFDQLAATGIDAVNYGAAGLPDFANFETGAFGRVVGYKFIIGRELLASHEKIWWIDGDIVARRPMVEHLYSTMTGSYCDMLMQYEWPNDVFNTGFWIARRTPAVNAMLDEMVRYVAEDAIDDQAYFNEYKKMHPELVVKGLDPDEYRCGNRFYHQYFFRPPSCYMMHFNYSIGQQEKLDLIKGHGLWHLDGSKALGKERRRHLLVTARKKAADQLGAARRVVRRAERALRARLDRSL